MAFESFCEEYGPKDVPKPKAKTLHGQKETNSPRMLSPKVRSFFFELHLYRLFDPRQSSSLAKERKMDAGNTKPAEERLGETSKRVLSRRRVSISQEHTDQVTFVDVTEEATWKERAVFLFRKRYRIQRRYRE